MNFFDLYPDNLFVPLASPNRRLYLELIFEIHEAFFSEFADFLETSISIPRIKDYIESYILQKQWEIEDTHNFELKTIDEIKTSAHYVFSVLKQSGWISIRKDGVKQEAYMSPRISTLVDFLQNSQQYQSGEVGGDVLSIYNSLTFLMEKQDATMIDLSQTLTKITKDTRNLGKQMKNLSLHLTDIAQDFKSYLKLKDKVKLFFEGFIRGSTFSDYNAIKGHNHPFRYRTEIIDKLYILEYDPHLKEKIISAISEYEKLTHIEAEEKYIKHLHIIRDIFNNTDHLITKIDISHDRLLRQVNESIKYQRRTPTNAGQLFTKVIEHLKTIQEPIQIDSPIPFPKAFSVDNVSRIHRRRPPIQQKSANINTHIPEATKRFIQAKRHYAERTTLTDQKFLAWLDTLFENVQPQLLINSQAIIIHEIEDLIGFSHARRLSLPDGKLHNRYRKSLAKYKFTRKNNVLTEHEYMICTPFMITKKEPSSHV